MFVGSQSNHLSLKNNCENLHFLTLALCKVYIMVKNFEHVEQNITQTAGTKSDNLTIS